MRPGKDRYLHAAVVIDVLNPLITWRNPIPEHLRRLRVANRATSTAGPAYLSDLAPDIATIPSQKMRDLLYRKATQEHVA
jgi:hypothetical protein